MNELYSLDRKRYSERSYVLRFLWVMRMIPQSNNSLVRILLKLIYKYYFYKYGLEISPTTKIGGGFYIGHAFNITINPKAIIGKNCNVHKGVLIGQENRGKRSGTPIIGDSVWIGINAAVVGNVRIGDDVLIAPNSFVNCDVPSHSVVFGNPCVIKPKNNATEGYVNRKV